VITLPLTSSEYKSMPRGVFEKSRVLNSLRPTVYSRSVSEKYISAADARWGMVRHRQVCLHLPSIRESDLWRSAGCATDGVQGVGSRSSKMVVEESQQGLAPLPQLPTSRMTQAPTIHANKTKSGSESFKRQSLPRVAKCAGRERRSLPQSLRYSLVAHPHRGRWRLQSSSGFRS